MLYIFMPLFSFKQIQRFQSNLNQMKFNSIQSPPDDQGLKHILCGQSSLCRQQDYLNEQQFIAIAEEISQDQNQYDQHEKLRRQLSAFKQKFPELNKYDKSQSPEQNQSKFLLHEQSNIISIFSYQNVDVAEDQENQYSFNKRRNVRNHCSKMVIRGLFKSQDYKYQMVLSCSSRLISFQDFQQFIKNYYAGFIGFEKLRDLFHPKDNDQNQYYKQIFSKFYRLYVQKNLIADIKASLRIKDKNLYYNQYPRLLEICYYFS